MTQYIPAALGGVLIGLAALLMLFWNGRVTGVSGIINESIRPRADGRSWRISFLLGLLAGGYILDLTLVGAYVDESNRGYTTTAIAGLLVGFGTVMGSGCTSGHGICGISRLSLRSIVATVTFMIFGILSATVFRIALGSIS